MMEAIGAWGDHWARTHVAQALARRGARTPRGSMARIRLVYVDRALICATPPQHEPRSQIACKAVCSAMGGVGAHMHVCISPCCLWIAIPHSAPGAHGCGGRVQVGRVFQDAVMWHATPRPVRVVEVDAARGHVAHTTAWRGKRGVGTRRRVHELESPVVSQGCTRGPHAAHDAAGARESAPTLVA